MSERNQVAMHYQALRPRLIALTVTTAGLAVAAWVGCGGSGDATVDVMTAPDGGNDTGLSATDGGSGDAGGSSDAGGSAADGASADGAAGDGAPATGDGGASDGGVNPADAGPGGTATTLTCGTTTCAIPAQTCCVQSLGGGVRAYACSAADAGCAPGGGGGDTTALKCSGQANCAPGLVCCVSQTNAGAASDCKPTCTQNEAQLCDKSAPDAGCPSSQGCSSANITDWGLPLTYATCGGKGN
jgi:hypothetical protein